MVWRRVFRAFPTTGWLSALRSGNKMYNLGKKLQRKEAGYVHPKRRRRIIKRRRNRNRRLVKRFGFADQRVVRMSYTGVDNITLIANAQLQTPMYLVMNDVGKPHPVNAGNFYTTMAGYALFKSLYTSFVVLGAKLSVTVRPRKFFNTAQAASGTSTYIPYGDWPVMKWGVFLHDAADTGSYTKWSDLCLDPSCKMRTILPKVDSSGTSSLKIGYSPRKFWSVSSPRDTSDEIGADFGSVPQQRCFAVVWFQTADQVTNAAQLYYSVSYRITAKVLCKDLKGFATLQPEDTLIPVPN